MGSSLILGLTGLFIIIVFYYFYKKTRRARIIRPAAVKDVQAEVLYKQQKNKEEKNLSLKERMELSWQFLYSITEEVLKKFSSSDLEAVHKIGKNLSSAGMKYVHVVELGIEKAIVTPGLIEQEKNQDKIR